MKRTSRLLVALVLSAGPALAACGSNDTRPASATSDTARGKKVVYIAADPTEYYGSVSCGAEEVARQAGVEYSRQISKEFSPAVQTPLLNSVVATRPDVILISATNPAAMVAPLKRAAAQGIKIITVSNSITDDSFLTSKVVLNSEENGRLSARALAQRLEGREGDVAFMAFTRGGSSIVDGRQDGFEAEIKKYPNLRYIGPQVVAGGYDDGAKVSNAILSGNPNLIGVVGAFEYAAVPMGTALRQRGLEDKVVLVASDADIGDVKNFKAGMVDVLLADKFREQGGAAMRQAIKALEGKPVDKVVSTDPVVLRSPEDPALKKYAYSSTC